MKKKKSYNEIRTYATYVDVLKISSHYSKRLTRFGSRGPKLHRKALRPRRPRQTVLQGQYYTKLLST